MGTNLGELGRRFNRARSIGGLGFAVAIATIGVFIHPLVVAIGGAVAVYNRLEVYYRSRHPDSPVLYVLVADTLVAGFATLLIGPVPQIILAMYTFVLVNSIFWVTRKQVLLLTLLLSSFVVGSTLLPGHLIDFGDRRSLAIWGTIASFGVLTLWMAETAAETIRAGADIERAAYEKERDASRMKDQFVSMISHELRTPITSLIGFSETLEESWEVIGPAEAKEFLSIIHGEAANLRQIVEDILLIPGLEAGRLPIKTEDFAIAETISGVIRALFPAGSSQTVAVDLPNITVSADPGRTKQVVRNLLRNAQKYGGNHISITLSLDSGMVVIRVRDDGAGVPPSERETIFAAFHQVDGGDTRKEGLGLGLPISRALARAMGGDLWYEADLGCTFAFSIPLAPSELAA